MSTPAIHPKVEDYIASVKKQTETLVKERIPEKILALNTLMESHFTTKDLSALHQNKLTNLPEEEEIFAEQDQPSSSGIVTGQKRKHASAAKGATEVEPDPKSPRLSEVVASCNQNITELLEVVKPAIKDLVEDANLLKMWVKFLMPKIEDGNNFGVAIQENTLDEIVAVEREAEVFFQKISVYYMMRAKLITKLAKYPQVDDYRRVIDELDENEYITLRVSMSEIRNHYAALYDLITKNWEKITIPRSSNIHNMY